MSSKFSTIEIVFFPKQMNVSERDAYRFTEGFVEPFGKSSY